MEMGIRRSPSTARFHVKQRDKGVCAACGCDTAKLQRVLNWAAQSRYRVDERRYWYVSISPWESPESSILRTLGFDPDVSLWAADHIVEVVDGGGECGLDGYQTLCVPCHKAKTKRQARVRRGLPPEEPASPQSRLF